MTDIEEAFFNEWVNAMGENVFVKSIMHGEKKIKLIGQLKKLQLK